MQCIPLRFVIPNGSLSLKVRNYLEVAGYPVQEPNRTGFCGQVGNALFFQFDRRMVAHFVSEGKFHAGITGHDLLLASGETGLRRIAELNFSRATNQPTRWVLVCREGFDWKLFRRRPARIACELPILAEQLLADKKLQFKYEVRKIEGSEEQCVASGLAELALVVTETGSSIKANHLEIFPGCEVLLVSRPWIIAQNGLNADQENDLMAITCALQSVVSAQDRVMLSFDYPDTVDLASLGLPSSVSPTISPLTKTGWSAGQICIPRSEIGRTTLKLSRAGAQGIATIALQGYF